MKSKTIAVDARPLARKMSGIRRYTEELLKILLEDDSIHWLLYTDVNLNDKYEFAEKDNVDVYVVPDWCCRRLLWTFYSALWLYRHRPNIYWSPRHHLPFSAPKDTALFLTIHDLVWLENWRTMPVMAYISERIWTRRSILRANILLTVSDTTARKIKEHFKSYKGPIFKISNGYNPPVLATKPKTLDLVDLGEFFVTVGTQEPRKNYSVLISAFHKYLVLGGTKSLLIIGNKGWGVDMGELTLLATNFKEKILVLEEINDGELRWCYENAKAFVSASINEGFGIPLIEAQFFGLPLIVSDIEPYREIAGPKTVFFDPLSEESITNALLDNDQIIITKDLVNHVNIYSWKSSANKLSDLFWDLLNDDS